MRLEPVQSSNVRAVGYDAPTQTMHVAFHGGRTYEYTGVSPEEHRSLVGADSIGSHFHHHIKSRYTGRKL